MLVLRSFAAAWAQNRSCVSQPFDLPYVTVRFINARRRILQPMLDSNDSKAGKKLKPTPNRPQKFWPNNLAEYLNKQDSGTITDSYFFASYTIVIHCVDMLNAKVYNENIAGSIDLRHDTGSDRGACNATIGTVWELLRC